MHQKPGLGTRVSSGKTWILLGTHTFAATGEGGRRQAAGVSSMQALRGVELINVQFAENPHQLEGVRTLPVLTQTSNGVTGRRGIAKPIMSEIFDALAAEAKRLQLPYFCFSNADIVFTQEAVDWMIEGGKEAYILSRQDFDGGTGERLKMETAGTDVFTIATDWWGRHRALFRPYIAAEGIWDNVYTAVLLSHADAAIENRRPLVRHESHPPGPMPSLPFGQYMRMLAAFDARYFSSWCRYWDGLLRLREAGASDADEARLAREVFARSPSISDRAVQAGRDVKAWVRYHWWRLRAGAG